MRAVNVSTGEREDLKALTSLRFMAALPVFLAHFPPTQHFAERLSFGYAGVGFFFVLSGFILTYTYRDAFNGALTSSAMRAFHVARIARIYPLHVVVMAATILWIALFGSVIWNSSDGTTRVASIVEQAFLIHAWAQNYLIRTGVNFVSWSLSVEAFFYLVFPLVAWLLFRALRGASDRRVLTIVAVCWATFAIVLAPIHLTEEAWLFYSFPPIRLPDFVLGMLLAIAFLRRSPSQRRTTALEIGSLVTAGLALAASPIVPTSLRYAVALMPCWALIISVFGRQRGALSSMLSHPIALRLGEISFAFYLVHYDVLMVVQRFFGWANPLESFWVAFSLTLLASFALFHWVETPMRRWIRGTPISLR